MEAKLYSKFFFYLVNNTIESYKVFSNVSLGKPRIESTTKDMFTYSGVVSLMNFKGGASGRILMALDKPIALKITEGFTEQKKSDIDEEVLFSIGEFLNIVGGRAISLFNNEFNDMRLLPSPPISFYGEELKFVNFKVSGFNILFTEEDGAINFNIMTVEEKDE